MVYCITLASGCAGPMGSQRTTAEDERDELYIFIHNELAKEHQHIDYETLMTVYKTMLEAPYPIPHTDELLYDLIRQRNEDPRVDKIVIIFAAIIIGKSKYPITDAQGLFETILHDDNRINDWVIAYVGRAIGSYPVDLPNGDQLVNRIEAHQARLTAKSNEPEEYFGVHFLPPPKTQRIKSYLAGIQDSTARGNERRAYYILIKNHITEDSVVLALNYLQSRNHSDSMEASKRPMKYMVLHWKSLQEELTSEDYPKQ